LIAWIGKLLAHYGAPSKIIRLIQNTYFGMSCKVTHAKQILRSFVVETGVQQGCLLSAFLFLLVLDHDDHCGRQEE
jgi:hypothetical protein